MKKKSIISMEKMFLKIQVQKYFILTALNTYTCDDQNHLIGMIAKSLFDFTGQTFWRDHIFNDEKSIQMEKKQASTTGNKDKDKTSFFIQQKAENEACQLVSVKSLTKLSHSEHTYIKTGPKLLLFPP